MYLLAAKILGPIALLLGLWWWHTSVVSTAYKNGKAEITAQWNADKDRAANVARQADIEARAEEQRRVAAQKGITDEFDRRLKKARADAVNADVASSRLQQRVAALSAASRQSACDPATVQPSTPANDATGVLADLQRRADERAGILARIADERGAAGAACEREYDALTASP